MAGNQKNALLAVIIFGVALVVVLVVRAKLAGDETTPPDPETNVQQAAEPEPEAPAAEPEAPEAEPEAPEAPEPEAVVEAEPEPEAPVAEVAAPAQPPLQVVEQPAAPSAPESYDPELVEPPSGVIEDFDSFVIEILDSSFDLYAGEDGELSAAEGESLVAAVCPPELCGEGYVEERRPILDVDGSGALSREEWEAEIEYIVERLNEAP